MVQLIDKVLVDARRIQQIPAPGGAEAERALYVRSRMEALDLSDIEIDACGNACARIPGSLPAERWTLFTAHMDTVFPLATDLTCKENDTDITGPGIGDNSLGVAALLAIPDILDRWGIQPRGDVWLCATVGEEGLGNLRGIWALLERWQPQLKAVVALEGMGLGMVVNGGVGIRRFTVRFTCAGGHGWANYGQPSAVHEAARCAAEILAQAPPPGKGLALNIGLMQGGTSVNTIAAEASFELEVRAEEEKELGQYVQHVRDCVQRHQATGCTAELIESGTRPSGMLSPAHWLVGAAKKALAEAGVEGKLGTGSTEANAPLSLGIPAVTLGITRGSGAHTLAECIEKGGVEKGLVQMGELARQIL